MANAAAQESGHVFLHDPELEESSQDFMEYWRTLRKHLWTILAFALVVTLLAGVVAFVSTPVFEAKTTVLIETNKQKVTSIEDVYGGVGTSREYFQTQVEILKSRGVAIKTIHNLKLYDHPDYDPRGPKKGLAVWKEKIGFGSTDLPTEWTAQTMAEAIAPRFMSEISVEPIRLSQLVVIRFQSPDADLAASVTNMVAKTYIENDLDARYQMTRTANEWLQGQLGELKQKMTQSEQALQGFREKQGIVSMKEGPQNGTGQQVEQLQSRLIEASTRLAEIESTYRIIKDAQSTGDLASQPAVLINAQVSDAKRQAAETARKLADVSQRYGREHPRYMQADSEAKAAAENLQRQIELVVGGVNNEYERARSTVKMLESALAAARGTVVNINRKEFALGIYEREVESNRQMYDMFIKRAKETNVAGDLQTTVARIVDSAVVPKTPVKPKKMFIVTVALAVGLLLGAAMALLVEVLDNTFKTSADVESRLKQPLLTVVPMLAPKDAERASSGRRVVDDPNSMFAEAIRTARTGVLLSSVDLASRTLLVTSSVPGEGKTTFASNLALSLAMTKKTLLIDADMRHPNVAKAFGLDGHVPGLSELVAGTAQLTECVQQVEKSNLTVMPSGAIPPNPLELLHSIRFVHTLQLLAKTFEIIVIDSPPIELVSDAQVIAAHASDVIFLTKAQSTPAPIARKALQRLHRANAHLVGIVLYALDFNKAEKYYGESLGYGKFDYGSTYGGSYGAKSAAPDQKTA